MQKFQLTINGKNCQNAHRRSYCYYGNGERWRRNKHTGDFDRKKVKLILPLMVTNS